MASRFSQKRLGKCPDNSDSYLLREPSTNPLNERSLSAYCWPNREHHGQQRESLREHVEEMDEQVARLQDMLKCERAKCTRLQLRCNQQEAELRRREQHCNRLKERLSLVTDRHREKGPAIEVLNFAPGGRGKREQPIRSFRSATSQEEATLRLMLERREAELREAMKLRHSLTTLLHALRVNMEQTMKDSGDVEDEDQNENRRLDQAEVLLGDHVTGGVVQSWRQVQKRLSQVLPDGHIGLGTDHDKLLARLEAELKETQQVVRLQQQLLQDSLASPLPSELADSYFLEEWERLQMRSVELDYQRRTFERERQSFTEAAIRLSRERQEFEQQKASLVKQQYLCASPVLCKEAKTCKLRESPVHNSSGLGLTSISGCIPLTPSSSSAFSNLHQGRLSVHTPTTPELYSALNLSYNCRTRAIDQHLETWDCVADGTVHTPKAPHLDWSF